MDKPANAKIVQAVLSFLEAIHGGKDPKAISELIRGMLNEVISADNRFRDAVGVDESVPWSKLDHGVRSTMNGILGFTAILLEEISDPELKWKVEQINLSAMRLMKMLENTYVFGYKEIKSSGPILKPAEEPTIAPDPLKIPLAPPKKPRSAGKRLPRVLIVEDNMVNSNLLMQYIKKYCTLFFSQTGQAAIEVAKREHIDLIFMDINLGKGIDGIEAMREIRKQVENEGLPIIAITGFAGKQDRDWFIQAGFTDFIAKPYERQDVVSIIDKLFNQPDQS